MGWGRGKIFISAMVSKQIETGSSWFCTSQLNIKEIKYIYLNCSGYGTCNMQFGVCQYQDLRILFKGHGGPY